jgi:DNA-binding NarL/FixJ family response regulator
MPLSQRESLLLQAEELAQMGSWEVDLATREALYSDGLYRILGEEPGALPLTAAAVLARTHPDDREALRSLLVTAREDPAAVPAEGVTAEYRWVRSDGALRDVRLHGHIQRDDEGLPMRWFGVVQDVTEQRLRQRELQARYAVTQTLREWESFDEGVISLLRRFGTALDFPLAGLWIWDEEESRITLRAAWSPPTVDSEEFDALTRSLHLRPGEGFVGRVWVTGEPAQSPDLTASSDTALRYVVDTLGIRSGLAFPARGSERTLAVLSFYAYEPREPSEQTLLTLRGAGEELGDFLERRRADLQPGQLSARELEVLGLAADGLTGPQIAERLFVSPTTVKTHFEHIYEKLGVGDRAAAVAHALRTGLIR